MTRKRNTASRAASSRVADNLKSIKGIGPAFEKCLHNAGVRTFAQLAKKSPEDVATHISNLSASQIRKQGWITQARTLASRKAGPTPHKTEANGLPSRQHYENFTLEFLLTEKNHIRRLRVVHIQSGDVDSWTRWNPDDVSGFLARHTKARFPKRTARKSGAPAARSKPAAKATKPKGTVKPKTKRNTKAVKKVSTHAVQTAPKAISQKPKATPVPEEKKGQVEAVQPEPKEIKYLAPITFIPAVRASAKNTSREPKAASASVDEKQQEEKVRVLNWVISIAGSNQPVRSLSHDQTFDVRLTLDISRLAIPRKSNLDITGKLFAKKLGSTVRHAIGETQAIIPYSPTIDLTIGKAALTQGLYRLEAQINLSDSEAASLQGGLFQVY